MKQPRIVRQGDKTTLKNEVSVLLCFATLLSVATYLYGPRCLLLTAVGAISFWLADIICNAFQRRRLHALDLSPWISGAAFAFLLPASASLWLPVFGSFFACLVVKVPFGGKKACFINPVAAAFCFSAISWSQRIFRFPQPFVRLPLFSDLPFESLVKSPAAKLVTGGTPNYSFRELLMGNFPGSFGTTCVLVIAISVVVLFVRKYPGLLITVSVLLSSAIFSVLFPRVSSGHLDSLLFELCSGCLLFGAVFLAPMAHPFLRCKTAQIIFGLSLGIITMSMRAFGGFEESFCFALLLCCCIIPLINRISLVTRRFIKNLWNDRIFKKSSNEEARALNE